MASKRTDMTLHLTEECRKLLQEDKIVAQDVPIEDLFSAVFTELSVYANTYTSEQFQTLMESFERNRSYMDECRKDKLRMLLLLENLIAYLLSISDAVRSLANRDYWNYKHRDRQDDIEVKQVIDEVHRRGDIRLLNYPFVDDYMELTDNVAYDPKTDMRYILHQGKRMYFPRGWSEHRVLDYYHTILAEQDDRSPHSYRKEGYDIRKGDILIDVGAAEGFFTLEHIDDLEKAYLIDADPEWIEALSETFQSYAEKVELLVGYIGRGNDTEGTVSLDELFRGKKVDYIKMDIEGYEKDALIGASAVLEENEGLRCAICSYHCKEDEKKITEYLNSKGYLTAHSGGYMCPDWCLEGRLDAELRRGIVFGKRI